MWNKCKDRCCGCFFFSSSSFSFAIDDFRCCISKMQQTSSNVAICVMCDDSEYTQMNIQKKYSQMWANNICGDGCGSGDGDGGKQTHNLWIRHEGELDTTIVKCWKCVYVISIYIYIYALRITTYSSWTMNTTWTVPKCSSFFLYIYIYIQ